MRKKIKNGDNIFQRSLGYSGMPCEDNSGLVFTCKAVGTIKQVTSAHIFYIPLCGGEPAKIARNLFHASEGKSRLGIVRGMRYECYTGSEELCKNLCLRAAQEIRDKNRMMLETQQELLKSLMRPIAGLEEDVTA